MTDVQIAFIDAKLAQGYALDNDQARVVLNELKQYRAEALTYLQQSGEWTGATCPNCNGGGEHPDGHSHCAACGGTGEEWASYKTQFERVLADLKQIKENAEGQTEQLKEIRKELNA